MSEELSLYEGWKIGVKAKKRIEHLLLNDEELRKLISDYAVSTDGEKDESSLRVFFQDIQWQFLAEMSEARYNFDRSLEKFTNFLE